MRGRRKYSGKGIWIGNLSSIKIILIPIIYLIKMTNIRIIKRKTDINSSFSHKLRSTTRILIPNLK